MSVHVANRIQDLAQSYPSEFVHGLESGKRTVEAMRGLAANNGTNPPSKGVAMQEAAKHAMNALVYSDGQPVEPAPTTSQLEAARYGAETAARELFKGRRY